MREIKFRVWHKIHKDIDFVEWIDFKDEQLAIPTASYIMQLDEVELMQYTGLKDINGVPVYEGDIIKDRNDNELGVIDFDKGSFIVKFQREGDFYLLDCPLSNLYFDIEVIGNIYENPELLTTKE